MPKFKILNEDIKINFIFIKISSNVRKSCHDNCTIFVHNCSPLTLGKHIRSDPPRFNTPVNIYSCITRRCFQICMFSTRPKTRTFKQKSMKGISQTILLTALSQFVYCFVLQMKRGIIRSFKEYFPFSEKKYCLGIFAAEFRGLNLQTQRRSYTENRLGRNTIAWKTSKSQNNQRTPVRSLKGTFVETENRFDDWISKKTS